MLRRAIPLTVFIALFGLAARADDKPIIPKTAPPRFMTVNEFDTGKEELLVGVTRKENVAEVRTRVVEVMGQKVTQSYTVTRPVMVSVMMKLSTHGAKFLNGEGKPVSKASAIQMFKPGTVILWVEVGDSVDPLFFKVLSRDALIVIPEEVAAP